MKKTMMAAVAAAAMAWAGAAPGGMGVLWTTGGGVAERGGNAFIGPGVAANGAVTWQLLYAGANGKIDDPDRTAEDLAGGDDVVLATRVVPRGGGTAGDGTAWDDLLIAQNNVPVMYVDKEWSRAGYVFQRIWQEAPEGEMAYGEGGWVQINTNYAGGVQLPDLSYFDARGNGVVLAKTFAATATLTVESGQGTAVPGAGVNKLARGEAVEARMEGSPAALGTGLRAVCTGWELEGNEPGSGTGTTATFTLTNTAATLRWTWETQAWVTVSAGAHGTASGGGWVAVGGAAELRATPEAGHPFTGWEGSFGTSAANPLRLEVTGPAGARATFYTTYYAGADGDDAADGLGKASAKREIAAALAVAAEGDTVVAGPGTYGAAKVPGGVTVRGEGGAEKTLVVARGAGRCVEVAAGAVVEGLTLTGGWAQGDGGGALLAEGAALRRCILRGNEATGAGGGAWGGELENCLVVSNRAAAGGGASGAALRHCTVAGNAGGGVKDCTVENGIVWGNAGGAQAEGGSVSWSLCEGASGPGCVEGEPGFMDAAGRNWRLAYGSRCIDAAAESGVALDLDGSPRPQPKVYGEAAKADMGCYEYVPKARFVWKDGNAVPPYESWADAAHEIQDALDVSADGDLVVVEAGTYGAFAASNAVTLTGLRGAERTFIDAEGAGRGATMAAGGVLEGFTVRNGDAGDENGGGIWAGGGAVVRDVTVENCRADSGGGIYVTGTGTVERCVLRGNTATSGGGAAVADGSRMVGCEIADNEAASAGGVLVEGSELAECRVRDNRATGGTGGGVFAVNGTLHNNVVTGNSAPNQGGGMGLTGCFAHDCIVAGNRAAEGAGVWMMGGETWNFTVADNLGSGAGVALSNLGDMTGGFANGISWNNAGENLDAAEGTVAKHVCTDRDPLFAGEGDYHLRAGSPCIDAGEVRDWMPDAFDMDGQRRVEPVDGIGGRDTRVDIGADEAALDAVSAPTADDPAWTWRVVPDASLQLQSTTNLLLPASWTNEGAAFTATNQVWKLTEPFTGTGALFRRLIWLKE